MNNLDKQRIINEALCKKLKSIGIKNLCITSCGNSIASGYAKVNRTIPLLKRNEALKDACCDYGIKLETHDFSVPKNNCDEHIFSWFVNPVNEGEIASLNRRYFESDSVCPMKTIGMDDDTIKKYYLSFGKTTTLSDILSKDDSNLSNILVYCGGTGALLDGYNRGGRINFLSSIKKDIVSMESILKLVNEKNRNSNSEVQIYLVGSPNYLGLHITDIVNIPLKILAKKYPNVVYVEPGYAKFIYDGQIDFHYDEDEYIDQINRINLSITDNFNIRKALIKLDKGILTISKNIEKGNYFLEPNAAYDHIKMMIELLEDKLNDKEKEKFRKLAYKLIKDRFPLDYFYIGEENKNKVYEFINKESKVF